VGPIYWSSNADQVVRNQEEIDRIRRARRRMLFRGSYSNWYAILGPGGL
jgi:hypothetical protein